CGGHPPPDYDAIVLERKGRRVDLAKPDRSLVFLKPTGELPHEGGVRLADGSPGEKRLLDWLSAGAPRAKTPRKLTHLAVGSTDTVVTAIGATVLLTATARFDAGKSEDVTPWPVF